KATNYISVFWIVKERNTTSHMAGRARTALPRSHGEHREKTKAKIASSCSPCPPCLRGEMVLSLRKKKSFFLGSNPKSKGLSLGYPNPIPNFRWDQPKFLWDLIWVDPKILWDRLWDHRQKAGGADRLQER